METGLGHVPCHAGVTRGDTHLCWDTSLGETGAIRVPGAPLCSCQGSWLPEEPPELGGAGTQQARHDLLSGMQSNVAGKTPGFPA